MLNYCYPVIDGQQFMCVYSYWSKTNELPPTSPNSFTLKLKGTKDKSPNFSSWANSQHLLVWLVLKALLHFGNVSGIGHNKEVLLDLSGK